MPEDADAAVEGVRDRAARYESAGALRRAALRLANQAPDPAERERLRRERIGTVGRVSEDVGRLVAACDPVWELLAERGLPPDLSRRELRRIAAALTGRPAADHALPQVSLRFHADEVHVSAVRNLIPALRSAHAVDGYRYATLLDHDTGSVEPFVIALHQRHIGDHAVVGTMFLGATFLRYELELGTVEAPQLERFARAVADDLELVASTRAALADT